MAWRYDKDPEIYLSIEMIHGWIQYICQSLLNKILNQIHHVKACFYWNTYAELIERRVCNKMHIDHLHHKNDFTGFAIVLLFSIHTPNTFYNRKIALFNIWCSHKINTIFIIEVVFFSSNTFQNNETKWKPFVVYDSNCIRYQFNAASKPQKSVRVACRMHYKIWTWWWWEKKRVQVEP